MKKGIIKKSKRKITGCLLVLLFALCLKADAQFDVMLTQYMNNEMFINPAYAGTRRVLAATIAYRNQWVGMEGAPITQTFYIHSPVGDRKSVV